MNDLDIERLIGMHPILHWLQPWRKWRLEDMFDPRVAGIEMAGPSPWPMIAGEIVSAVSLNVAAKMAGNKGLHKHAAARLSAAIDECGTIGPKPPFPPKGGGTNAEKVLVALVAIRQSLTDEELREGIDSAIKTIGAG